MRQGWQRAKFETAIVRQPRNPLTSDYRYYTGTFWINTLTDARFQLKTVSGSTATWESSASGDTYVTDEWYEEISSGTTGTITPPTGASFVMDQWPGDIDAIVSTVTTGEAPDLELARDTNGNILTVTLTSGGAYTLSGTAESYPVAIIYAYRVKFSSYDDTKSLNAFIIDGQSLAKYKFIAEYDLTNGGAQDLGAIDITGLDGDYCLVLKNVSSNFGDTELVFGSSAKPELFDSASMTGPQWALDVGTIADGVATFGVSGELLETVPNFTVVAGSTYVLQWTRTDSVASVLTPSIGGTAGTGDAGAGPGTYSATITAGITTPARLNSDTTPGAQVTNFSCKQVEFDYADGDHRVSLTNSDSGVSGRIAVTAYSGAESSLSYVYLNNMGLSATHAPIGRVKATALRVSARILHDITVSFGWLQLGSDEVRIWDDNGFGLFQTGTVELWKKVA